MGRWGLAAALLFVGCGQREIRACAHPTTARWQDWCDLITEAAFDRTEALGCEQPTDDWTGNIIYNGACFGSRTTCQEQAEDCAAVIDAAPTCAEVERIWRTCLSG